MTVPLDKANLLPIMTELRELFRALGRDIARYDDDALTDAVLAVCPVVGEGWPSDEQVQLIFARLTRGHDPT